MKLKKTLFMMLIAVISIFGMASVSAMTISENGKYSLVMTVDGDDFDAVIDDEYAKIVRFDVAADETTVKLSELTKGITPFNGKNEFSHWVNRDKVKVNEDFSISDFVADLRAPTPTAAAELAVPDINTIVSYLNTVKTRAYNGVNQLIINNQLLITKIKDSYVLTHPMSLFERKEQKLDTLIDKLNKEITIILDKHDIKLKHIISSLQVLNPLNTLNRGYAIIRKDNKVISSVGKIKKDDEVIINLKDGIITSKVIKVGE